MINEHLFYYMYTLNWIFRFCGIRGCSFSPPPFLLNDVVQQIWWWSFNLRGDELQVVQIWSLHTHSQMFLIGLSSTLISSDLLRCYVFIVFSCFFLYFGPFEYVEIVCLFESNLRFSRKMARPCVYWAMDFDIEPWSILFGTATIGPWILTLTSTRPVLN